MSCNNNPLNYNPGAIPSQNDYPVENIDSRDIPVYEQVSLPNRAYLPMLAEQYDPQCSQYVDALWYLPISKLTPGGTFQLNTYSLQSPTSTLVVPDRQVVPAYVTAGLPNQIEAAASGSTVTRAKFIVLGQDPNNADNMLIQSSGYYTFTEGHDYIVGYTYYVHETNPGQLVNLPSGSDPQKAFYVVNSSTIQITIGD